MGGDDYRRGIELICKRNTTAWSGCLSPLDARRQKFDPDYHQAVGTVKTEELEDQTIIEEHQRGCEFKGRLLRPATVKVAVRE